MESHDAGGNPRPGPAAARLGGLLPVVPLWHLRRAMGELWVPFLDLGTSVRRNTQTHQGMALYGTGWDCTGARARLRPDPERG